MISWRISGKQQFPSVVRFRYFIQNITGNFPMEKLGISKGHFTELLLSFKDVASQISSNYSYIVSTVVFRTF